MSLPSLAEKNIGVTDNKAVFKKRRSFTEVQDVITNFGFEFTIELVCKNWESKLAKTSFDMISNCFQLFVPAGFGSTWRCSNVSNYHDSAPLWIGQTWAAKWKSKGSEANRAKWRAWRSRDALFGSTISPHEAASLTSAVRWLIYLDARIGTWL